MYTVSNIEAALSQFRRQNGLDILVKWSQRDLEEPPATGSILTVKHAGNFSNGRLRSPIFWRVRTDVEWKHLPAHLNEVVSVFNNCN